MSDGVQVFVNGRAVVVAPGPVVAAAVALAGETEFRRSPLGSPRGPLCGMGVCMECRLTINGQSECRSCQTLCETGMRVQTHD